MLDFQKGRLALDIFLRKVQIIRMGEGNKNEGEMRKEILRFIRWIQKLRDVSCQLTRTNH